MDDITEPLRKPARPARTALLIGAGALVIAGTTWGGIAIAQSGQPADEVGFVAAEPTETPEVPNVAPTATAQVTGQTDLTVTVSGVGTDTDGEIASQGWNFGDGTFADGPDATHTYTAAGTYTITFAVSDDDGESTSSTVDVTVTAPPPPPAPEPPAPTVKSCPAGASAVETINGVPTFCMWDYCRNLTLPSDEHPECYPYFKP